MRRFLNTYPWVVVFVGLAMIYTHAYSVHRPEDTATTPSYTVSSTPLMPTQVVTDRPSIDEQKTPKIEDPTSILQRALVVRVVDGDTIRVLIENTEYTVRLIGIDAPESVDPRKPVQCYGVEASRKLAELIENQYVWLNTDDTQDEKDRYGRLLRYVYREDDTNIAEYMIRNGYAFEYTYRVPYQYQDILRQAQESAEYEAVGLWAPDACNDFEE